MGKYKITGEYKIRPYVRIHHNIWKLIFLFCAGFGAYRLPLAAADWAASKLLIVAHHISSMYHQQPEMTVLKTVVLYHKQKLCQFGSFDLCQHKSVIFIVG